MKLSLSLLTAALAVALGPGVALAQLPPGDHVPAIYQRSYDEEAAGFVEQALRTHERLEGEARKTYLFELRTGWLSYLAGKHGPAVEAYRRAVAHSPKAVEARVGLTLPLLAMRNWKEAITVAEETLKLDPGNRLARARLALALYNQGRFAEAATQYRAVLELYPTDAEMHAGLGWSLLKQGKTREAVVVFQEVLSFAPRHPSARDGLLAAGSGG